MPGGSSVLIDTPAEGVAVLTLNEPDRRNALSAQLVEDIVAAFDRFEQPDSGVRAVVVTGAPPAFCAGADLGHLGGSREMGLRSVYEAFLRVGRSTLPTLAAVNGAAVGAGMNLALCCDVRVAAAKARFDTRFVQLGLHPGGGHTWMLQRAVGIQQAAAMVLFGQVWSGEEAARRGLAYACVDDAELLDMSVTMAKSAADGPPELVQRVKRTLADMPGVDTHAAAVDVELIAQVWSLEQPFFAERLAQLRQKISGR